MTELKATPGPWSVKSDSITREYEIYGADYGYQNIVVAEGIVEEANAHLIAAAPELYEALLSARETFCNPPRLSDEQWNDYAEAVIEQIDTILARARGQS